MAPYSHIYVATKVFGSKNWQVVLGSIIPDIGLVLLGQSGFEWRQADSAQTAQKLLEWTQTEFRSLRLLAQAYALHTVGFGGADLYSDGTHRDGFAYRLGRPLTNQLKKQLNLPAEPAAIFSHNFIELAQDLVLLRAQPHLTKLVAQSAKEKNLKAIAPLLSLTVGYPENLYLRALRDFFGLIASKSPLTPRRSAEAFSSFLKRIRKHDFDTAAVESLLHQAVTIVEPFGTKLLDTAVAGIKGRL